MKFCQYVVSLYLHIFANFGQFILIFNKMALIFLGAPINCVYFLTFSYYMYIISPVPITAD